MKIFKQYPWLIAIVIIFVYLVLRRLGLMPNLFEKTQDQNENHNVNLSKLSYSKSQYETWANELQNYMDTETFLDPTDEEGIFRIYGFMQNEDDVHQLNNSFGIRPYTGDPYEIYFDPINMSLGGWLAEELDNDEMIKLNGILSSKGIKFKY